MPDKRPNPERAEIPTRFDEFGNDLLPTHQRVKDRQLTARIAALECAVATVDNEQIKFTGGLDPSDSIKNIAVIYEAWLLREDGAREAD